MAAPFGQSRLLQPVEINHQCQRDSLPGRRSEEANTSSLHAATDRLGRRRYDDIPLPHEPRLIIGHKLGAERHQLKHKSRLSAPRPAKDQQPASGDGHRATVDQCALPDCKCRLSSLCPQRAPLAVTALVPQSSTSGRRWVT